MMQAREMVFHLVSGPGRVPGAQAAEQATARAEDHAVRRRARRQRHVMHRHAVDGPASRASAG